MVGIPRSGDASGVRVNYEARCEDASVAILTSSMSMYLPLRVFQN
jgi:hypothetical protein